ncbi:MAG: TonB-dependent receptor [Bacteroidetes bacterium]|nr:TonB-dependent receptor [Bacteroidota bacterium]
MKNSLLIGFILTAFSAMAQYPQGGGQGARKGMNAGHFYGKIVDSKTNKGIELASVQLIGQKFDSVTKKMETGIIATVLSRSNGDFSLENIPVFGDFNMNVSAIGYADNSTKVSFGVSMKGNKSESNQASQMMQMMSNIDKDLGNIKMEPTENTLAGVTIQTAAKPFFEMGVDRKVFNVDKNIVSQGQTATEVMRQIPTLNVDIDGKVTMRNATPQLFIDGRPTTLTYDQIPADLIDKVELITNPSAKFDASGGGAGILNIVLKKNIKTGYNGGVRAGIDSKGSVTMGGDLSYRQNKINVSLSAGYNQRKSNSNSITDRNNISDTPMNIYSTDDGTSKGHFAYVRASLDYLIDIRNTLSFSYSKAQGKFNSLDDQVIDSIVNNNLASYSSRLSNSEFTFNSNRYGLSFKHLFTKAGHDITADINYNASTNTNNGNYITNTYYPDSNPKGLPVKQLSEGNGTTDYLVIQSDYENPITENTKFEAGVRAAIRNNDNLSMQSFYNDSAGKYLPVPALNSNYKFKDEVFAAYSTYSFKLDKFRFQLGLRAESSNYNGTLLGKDSSFKVDFPISLFPSAFITYQAADKQDIQLNYSRKINRPNFFQLLPFIDYSDPQNLSVGNAGLKPEFTDLGELSYNITYNNNSNFLATIYGRHTTNLITSFQYVGPSPLNPEDTVVFNTYANANNSWSYGLELTNRINLFKIWDLTLNVNLYNSVINGGSSQQNMSNQRVSWFGKWNNNIKLPKKFTIQFSGNYQAKTILPPDNGGRGHGGFFGSSGLGTTQGYIFPNYSFDLGLKKDWAIKGTNTLSLSLSMNDIFKTAVNKVYSESPYFTQISTRYRDPQVLRLNLSYRFGKIDANLFKRRNTKDQGGDTDMSGGMGGGNK